MTQYRRMTISEIQYEAFGLDFEGLRQLGLSIRREMRSKGLESHDKKHLRTLDDVVFKVLLIKTQETKESV